jgi:hypothetical protein
VLYKCHKQMYGAIPHVLLSVIQYFEAELFVHSPIPSVSKSILVSRSTSVHLISCNSTKLFQSIKSDAWFTDRNRCSRSSNAGTLGSWVRIPLERLIYINVSSALFSLVKFNEELIA